MLSYIGSKQLYGKYRRIVLGVLAVMALGFASPPLVPTAYAQEQVEGFVLQLDAPSARRRGKCVQILVNNVGALPERKVWIVARYPDREAGRAARFIHHAVGLSNVPAARIGQAEACLERMAGADGEARVPVEVAVYRATAQDIASGRWSSAGGDDMRLSFWLPLHAELWRRDESRPDAVHTTAQAVGEVPRPVANVKGTK
jgi:hypothetical protein